MAKHSTMLGLITLAITVSSLAVADDSGWYIGANVGQALAKIDDGRITRGLLATGLTTTSITDDDRHFGDKLYGGYKFNSYFALEGGYFDLGQFGFTATAVPPGTLAGHLTAKGLNLDAIGILPLVAKLLAFGRIGVNTAQVADTFSSTGSVDVLTPKRHERATNYKFGLGLQYDLTDSLGVRTEVERYRIDDPIGNKGDIDLVSVGLIYRLGGKTAAVPTAAILSPPAGSPIPVIEAAPLPVIVSSSIRTERYCSILDMQFDINQVDIQREEKEKLSVLGVFLERYPDTSAVIEGHAEKNMRLSQRRAQSVVRYLEDTSRLPHRGSQQSAMAKHALWPTIAPRKGND